VFFNLFFEVKPFAAILIVHGTNERSEEFEAQRIKIQSQRQRVGNGFLGPGQQAPSTPAKEFGDALSASPAGFRSQPRPQMHFGCTKSPKMRLVATNVI